MTNVIKFPDLPVNVSPEQLQKELEGIDKADIIEALVYGWAKDYSLATTVTRTFCNHLIRSGNIFRDEEGRYFPGSKPKQ